MAEEVEELLPEDEELEEEQEEDVVKDIILPLLMKDLEGMDEKIDEEMALRYIYEAEQFIKNFCFIPEIPDELFFTWVKLAKARLLAGLRGWYQIMGQDSPLTDNTITQYIEAEYAVKFAGASTSSGGNSSIAEYLAWLENSAIQELIPFKRVKYVGGTHQKGI